LDSKDSEFNYQRFVSDAAQVIQSAALTREMVRTTRLRIHLRELSIAAQHSVRPASKAELLEELLDAVVAATEAAKGNVQLWDGRALRIRAQRGFQPPFLEFFDRVEAGEAACGAALKAQRPIVVDHVDKSPMFSAAPRAAVLEAGVRAVQSLPISRHGEPLGVISVHYLTPGSASPNREPLEALRREIAEAIELCATPLPRSA